VPSDVCFVIGQPAFRCLLSSAANLASGDGCGLLPTGSVPKVQVQVHMPCQLAASN
jgi:hypothetical protein